MPVCAAVHVPPAVSPSLGGTLEKAPGCACLIYPAKHNCFCSVSQGHAETLTRRSIFVSADDSKQSRVVVLMVLAVAGGKVRHAKLAARGNAASNAKEQLILMYYTI